MSEEVEKTIEELAKAWCHEELNFTDIAAETAVGILNVVMARCQKAYTAGYNKKESHIKAKEAPRPLILPGYVVFTSFPIMEERTIVRHDPDGMLYYWCNSMLYNFHKCNVVAIVNHDGKEIWRCGNV